MKGVAVKNSGAQSYSSGALGYRAPVRQQLGAINEGKQMPRIDMLI